MGASLATRVTRIAAAVVGAVLAGVFGVMPSWADTTDATYAAAVAGVGAANDGGWDNLTQCDGPPDELSCYWSKPGTAAAVSQWLEFSGFEFPDVEAGDVLGVLTVTVPSVQSTPARFQAPLYELWDGTSELLDVQRVGASPSSSSSHADVLTFTGLTFGQLADLRLRVQARGGADNLQTAAYNVESVAMVLEYEPGSDPEPEPSDPPVSGVVTLDPAQYETLRLGVAAVVFVSFAGLVLSWRRR